MQNLLNVSLRIICSSMQKIENNENANNKQTIFESITDDLYLESFGMRQNQKAKPKNSNNISAHRKTEYQIHANDDGY